MASGRLVYATTTGTLSAVDFAAGLPTGSGTVSAAPRRRPVLAVQGPVRPQPPHLDGAVARTRVRAIPVSCAHQPL